MIVSREHIQTVSNMYKDETINALLGKHSNLSLQVPYP